MANTRTPLSGSSETWFPAPNRKRFTRSECEFLEKNDLLTTRYELIDGEILFKMPQKPPHKITIVLISEAMRLLFGGLHIMTQSSIDVASADSEINEPEPDVIVLAQPATQFATRNVVPADIVLLVEVSDSTLHFDLHNKALLYARAGIAEYWVADIGGRRMVTHRTPTISGYAEVIEYAEDEIVSPLARPDAEIRVADLLPPAQS